MNKSILFCCLFFAACNNDQAANITTTDSVTTIDQTSPGVTTDTVVIDNPTTPGNVSDNTNTTPPVTPQPSPPVNNTKTYGNDRFKDVRVQNLGNDRYRITGRAQVFEAAFSWVVEDGHNELKKGFEMTDAGAPEFGKFNFTVEAKKARPNSTLHLILFESSAKDGSRQYVLPVPLK